jgi:diguanylate cyclase (GGDEF)-like protein
MKMRLHDDFFDRDEEHLRFLSLAGKYLAAREKIKSLGMNPEEAAIHNEIDRLARETQSFNEDFANLMMTDASENEIDATFKAGQALREPMLRQLGLLVKLEQRNADSALVSTLKHAENTRQILIVLAVLAVLFSLFVTRLVIRRVSEKNKQLDFHASHDSLTGLINRREFEKRVQRAINQARAQSMTHTLFYMDLDQFKIVNDTCGHAAGDELLKQLSKLLLSSVRKRDTLGRLGGDEFGMLLENCHLEKGVEIANNLLTAIKNFHFTWEDETFSPGMSIGVVPIDRSTLDIATVLNAADSACYIAKESGRNRVQIAHLGNKKLQERHNQIQWVPRITRALEEDRFALYFQPIISLKTNTSHGKHIEILVRMLDGENIIVPGVFLPVAEKYGIAISIDKWVVRNAFAWLANSNLNNSPDMISINLSGQSVGDESILKFILEQFNEHNIPYEKVCFEITETAAIANITAATSFMLTLRGYGCRFSLDDFGSGLSSFSYLRKLPVDFLKIDGMFIRDVLSDPVDHAMVRSINELGHLLGKKTIAEFVETMDLADELKRMGIDYAQGYIYSPPQPIENYAHITGPQLVVVSG